MKLRRSLYEFIEPCKTGCDNTQKGHLLKATNIAVYIVILLLMLELWERRNFQGRGVSCILNSNIRSNIDFPLFLCKFLDILFEGDSLSQVKQLWNRMILQYMIYWAIKYRKLVYPILCEPTIIVLRI
jgi:hypothetical protein